MKPRILCAIAAAALGGSLSWSTAAALPVEAPTLPVSPILIADAELDIVDTAEQQGLTTFLALITELGLDEDLRGFGRFTVFVPSDAAFADFLAENPQFQGELTAETRSQVARVLAYHTIARGLPITTENFEETLGSRRSNERSLARPDLELRLRRGRIRVNGVEVVEADIEATNGVIHVIDEVLAVPAE
ncbi:MAG: fasciclin domain-containing protein [Cyanobacteria bacterium P01_A01_bin.135]